MQKKGANVAQIGNAREILFQAEDRFVPNSLAAAISIEGHRLRTAILSCVVAGQPIAVRQALSAALP